MEELVRGMKVAVFVNCVSRHGDVLLEKDDIPFCASDPIRKLFSSQCATLLCSFYGIGQLEKWPAAILLFQKPRMTFSFPFDFIEHKEELKDKCDKLFTLCEFGCYSILENLTNLMRRT